MKVRDTREDAQLPPGFGRLLAAWFAAQSADGMRFAALPLLAFATDPSPSAVAAVAAATALPWLLVALPAGVLVDRLDPAKVIAWANIARGLASSLVIAAITLGAVSIPLLAAIGFALTAAETFADSAAQSLLLRLVPHEQLERANARFVSSENIGLDLVGPLLSGGLFALGHALPFIVSAVAFVIAALAVFSLIGSVPAASMTSAASANPGGMAPAQPMGRHARPEAPEVSEPLDRSSIRGSFRAIFSDPALRSLVITVAVLAATVAAMEGVLVIYAAGPLHLRDALFPTLLAAYSVGLLASAPFVPRLVRRFGSGPVMVAALLLVSATLIVLGRFPSPPVAWAAFVVMGAAGGSWNILSATRRQRRTPRRIAAGVSSTFRAMSWGAVPLGTALGGLGAEHWGVARVFVIAGLVLLALLCVMARPLLRPERPLAEAALQPAGRLAAAETIGRPDGAVEDSVA